MSSCQLEHRNQLHDGKTKDMRSPARYRTHPVLANPKPTHRLFEPNLLVNVHFCQWYDSDAAHQGYNALLQRNVRDGI